MENLTQDWRLKGEKWVAARSAAAEEHIKVKMVKTTLKGYVSATGKWDLESLRLELTRITSANMDV